MSTVVRPLKETDVDALVELSLLAWKPVFASFRQVLGRAVYERLWPNWRKSQEEAVRSVCQDADHYVVVAEADQSIAGFVAYQVNAASQVGEVVLLAVHPDYQNRGIGKELNLSVLKHFKDAGMTMARVETGGDPAHAPARACYEKSGYTALPLVRYFKTL